MVTQTRFDAVSGQLDRITSGRLTAANNNLDNLYGDIQHLSYTYDSLGNLYSRATARMDNNGLAYESLTESFGYDKLNRLKQSTTTSTSSVFGRTQSYQYDLLGNLTSRSDTLSGSATNHDVGTLQYEGVRNAGIHAVTTANGINYSYDAYGNMTQRGTETLQYNVFNKPTKITAGSTITNFTYNGEDELFKETTGTKSTYKLFGGVYEIIVNGTTRIEKSYVDGVILNTRTLVSGTQTQNDIQYLHSDHLGSTESITNALGQFVTRMSFSTWGERQTKDWAPGPLGTTELNNLNAITTNGYTGHDQIDQHNLIHMGGRVYDPALGRFLSADLFVQSPYDSQSFNRYSYTFNNPLSNVDPDGYWTRSNSGSRDLAYQMNQAADDSSCDADVCVSSYRWNMEALYDLQSINDYIERAGLVHNMSWGAGPNRIYNLEPGIQEKCGGDEACAQEERIENAELFFAAATAPVGGELAFLGKAAWEARAAKIAAEKLAKALNVPGRVQSRVNVRVGDGTKNSGLKYALGKHGGNGPKNKSQFSISEDKLKELLQSKKVVQSPVSISSTSGNYMRVVDTGKTIGNYPINSGGAPTSHITILTDKIGNLINTFPGKPVF